MSWPYSAEAIAEILGAEAPQTNATCTGVSTDTRGLSGGEVFFALKGENFDANAFLEQAFDAGAAVTVGTRAVPGKASIVVTDPLEAMQRLAAHHRSQYTGPLFALTGSCGKTSAKDFLTSLLMTKYNVVKTQGNLNNEIGCPLSLLRLQKDTGFAVIEMGANHKGEIRGLCQLARPTEAAITIIAPAHLEGFGSIDDVKQAKGEILSTLEGDQPFYCNVDDFRCVALAEAFGGPVIRIGEGADAEVRLRRAAYDAAGILEMEIDPVGVLRLPLPIRAQATNVLLAIAVALRHGVTEFEEPLVAACKDSTRFKLEQVGPLEVLDDTYNANPASVRAALQALADRPATGRRMAALGAMLELGDEADSMHAEMGEAAAAAGVGVLFGRGPNTHAMIAAARAAGVSEASVIDDHAEMAAAIQSQARPGDVLLLKGSRGMRMERVLEHLRAHYGATATTDD
jgi:UDP-N-acetylmuramoyl-tripeptide--D-alanyl-D-alanine ligase